MNEYITGVSTGLLDSGSGRFSILSLGSELLYSGL